MTQVCMSDELSVAEKIVEEVLIDLITERVMSERGISTGVQTSSSGALPASVRKIGPQSNKVKQMWKQNTKYTQYNRDTDLHGSPNVGYVHQRIFQVLPLLLSNK
jgi:hypothetical protein